MKGIELPINILVVVAIAVIVLLGLVALYFIGFNPFSNTTALNAVKSDGCRVYLNQNPPCNDPTGVNVTWQGNIMNFNDFMTTLYKCGDTACINTQCNCPQGP